MKSKKPPILSLLGSLKWETGDTLVWTGTKFVLNGKVLEESEMLKKGVYADSGLEESAKCQDALNKAQYLKQECKHENSRDWKGKGSGGIDLLSCNDCSAVFKKPQPKQECNHEGMPKFFSPAFGAWVGACGRCADYVKAEDGKWVPIIPREQLKPSEWIKGRAEALCIEAEHYVANWTDYLGVATRDFLDEHANLFNK